MFRWIVISILLVILIIAALIFTGQCQLPESVRASLPGGATKETAASDPGAKSAPTNTDNSLPTDDPQTRIEEPSFDIVRVDAQGYLVAAGRGASGSRIELLANGEKLAEALVDDADEWLILLDEPLSAGTTELKLSMFTKDGRRFDGSQSVVVSVPDDGGTPLVALGRPGLPTKILQSPFEDRGDHFGLRTVDYDDSGGVVFTGKADPDTKIRLRLNGKLIGETTANAKGEWVLTAKTPIAAGVYDLQVEQLDAKGKPTKVATWPFERASADQISSSGAGSVIVQPGNSLWRIARRLYGEGSQYTLIYAANSGQIRNPDLIYPGQILDTPTSETTPKPQQD